MDGNIRLIDLTVNDLQALIEQTVADAVSRVKNNGSHDDEFVYGIGALAEILGCSVPHARYIKATGKYKDAIRMEGRKIVTNKTLLKRLMFELNKPQKPQRVNQRGRA